MDKSKSAEHCNRNKTYLWKLEITGVEGREIDIL